MDFEIGKDCSARVGMKLVRERAAYLDLVQGGVSNREACRVVGINPRTGTVWRNGRNPSRGHTGVAPNRALRTGRAMRRPRRQTQQRQPRMATPMVMISDRP